MLARCDGTRSGGYRLLCNGSVYQCACGHVGCAQSRADGCSKQGFTAQGQCAACGAVGRQTLLAPESVGLRRTLMQDPQSS